MNNYTYDAFISYRQKYDMDIAKPLLRNLEHYHIPFGLQKDLGKKKLKIFRDKDELRAGNNLSAEIRKALRHSEFLIVICSKDAKEAPWILKEINYFRKTHGNSNKNIITVLKKGEPQEAIPDILLHPTEPSSVDYRKKRFSRGLLLGLNKELPRIVSKLIGCEYDELVQRRKAFERIRMLIIATLVSLFSCLITLNIINYNIAQHEKAENLSYLSENAYNNYDRGNAVEHAISALSTKNIPEAKRALLTATEAYKFKQEEMGVIRNLKTTVPIKEYAIYSEGNGKYISLLGRDANIRSYYVKTGEEVLSAESYWELDKTTQNVQITDTYDAHITMCSENQLLFCCSSNITSFNLDNGRVWQKSLEIDSSLEYMNLSYNSDSITVGLKNGTIIILNKKTGRQIDSITPSKTITEIKDNQPIHAKISPDSRYLICRNESCAYLYDRNTKEFSVISNELHNKYQDIDEHIMGNFYLLAYGNRETKDVHILCYDMKRKTILSENHIEHMREYCTPWFIPLENAKINGKARDIAIVIIDNSTVLFDCHSGKYITEIQFTNRIQHVFLQKRDTKASPATHDYGILPSECNEDVLTVIFENGECADYSFQDETISNSYKAFKDGVVSVEKSNDYYFISHQNNLNEIKNDNTIYSENFGIKIYGEFRLSL